MIHCVEILARLLLASVLGALIGWDRETRGKPAGLRTLTMVSLASAIYVIAAREAALEAGEVLDSARIMSGIAQGVGFLGAGAILQAKGQVRWLTTAASLWAVAALGYACGVGQYAIAAIGTLLTIAALRWMTVVDKRIANCKSRGESEQP